MPQKQQDNSIPWPSVLIASAVLIALLLWAVSLFSESQVSDGTTLTTSSSRSTTEEAACEPGYTATDGARCCWPGQRSQGWRCVGPPSTCPEGFSAGQDGCEPTAPAIVQTHRRCAAGDGDGCHMAAVKAELGQGVEPDPELALSYLDRGCRVGHLRSCTVLARYLEEQGSSVDAEAVLEPLESACHENTPAACFQLAGYLHAGVGAPPHAQRALVLYDRACDLDHAPACRLAGVLRIDTPKAAEPYLSKGCALSDPESCKLLEGRE